jgi:diadenosine tetraphosphate (Ap4A) HIT family hydrolase
MAGHANMHDTTNLPRTFVGPRRLMEDCELCRPAQLLAENAAAYARYDSNSLALGHLIVVPRRHVADFFEMTAEEQAAVLVLLNEARRIIAAKHSPDGYNVGVNVGKAAGQSRMHVHVHLIPRYAGDVPDPAGGIRRVLQRFRT